MKDNDIKRIISDLTKHYSNTKNPVNFPHANTFDDLMYRAGLTAQGCWDSMDQYDRDAIVKFAELIVRECVQILKDKTPVIDEHDSVDEWGRGYIRAMVDSEYFIKEHFGVEE